MSYAELVKTQDQSWLPELLTPCVPFVDNGPWGEDEETEEEKEEEMEESE